MSHRFSSWSRPGTLLLNFTSDGKSHSASVIDPVRGAVIDTIPLPGKPEFAATDHAGHIHVNIENTSALVEIDTTGNKVLPMVWPNFRLERHSPTRS